MVSYQSKILNFVSRTFALTIPQLPSQLSNIVTNAYLLCRIVDTIEDEPNLTIAQKQKFSKTFIQVIAGKADANLLSENLYPYLSHYTLAAEKELILNLSKIISVTHTFTTAQQAALLRCVTIMADGMIEFQQKSCIDGLKNLSEMERYCYYVAGVVGEMLTELFCDYSSEIAKHKAHLTKLAPAFGQALQMTNILKDIWEDRQRGACWLPQDVFADVGFELKNLSARQYDPAFGKGLAKLIAIANENLTQALDYILLIPKQEKGIRRFCLWALGMAILTLKRINKRRDFNCSQQVKISRNNVKMTILISNMLTCNDTSLRILYYILTRKY
jgi:farnesyl-diphosphate farnesyltransferase